MPLDPLRFLERDSGSNAQDAAKMADLLLVFGDCHVIPTQCNVAALLEHNATIDDLEKVVKALKPFVDQRLFDSLWAKAFNAGLVLSAQQLSIRDMFRFQKWLSTVAGQAATRSVQQTLKLERAGKGKVTAEGTALLRLYQAQYDDRSRLLTQEMVVRDTKLAKYRRKMERARAKYETREAEIKQDFPVASLYEPLAPNLLKGRCWAKYVSMCNASGTEAVPKTSANLSIMVEKYGSDVKQEHLLEHCSLPANREMLLQYGAEKVKRLSDTGPERQLHTFRGYMAIASRGEAYDVPAEQEDAPADVNTSRTPSPEPLEQGEHSAGGSSDGGAATEATSDRDEEAPESSKRAGKRVRPTGSVRSKRARAGASKGRRAKKPRHPDVKK